MYIIMPDDEVFDYDLTFISPLMQSFDTQYKKVQEECIQSDDPDQFGILDRLDYLAGVGLTACQQYITSTYPLTHNNRNDALCIPPRHKSGQSIASLIYAGANYWKHHDEWGVESKEKRARTVMTNLLKQNNWFF